VTTPAHELRRARVRRLAIVWFAASTVLLVAPVYPWIGNRIEPRVLGLPWSLVWVLAVVLVNFAVLVALHVGRALDDDVTP
jgi:hypothetical protein